MHSVTSCVSKGDIICVLWREKLNFKYQSHGSSQYSDWPTDRKIRDSTPSRARYFFLLPKKSRPVLKTQWEPRVVSQGVKGWIHEAGHSPSSSAKVKNEWIIYSLPLNLQFMEIENFVLLHMNLMTTWLKSHLYIDRLWIYSHVITNNFILPKTSYQAVKIIKYCIK
jgi:hypothetical protein